MGKGEGREMERTYCCGVIAPGVFVTRSRVLSISICNDGVNHADDG